jgi:ribonuclease HI
MCLALYYACNKFRHYILSNACTVVCQHDVIKFMLHKPILSGRIRKWAYSLVEYDLSYEPLHAMKGQVVADFVVDHMIEVDSSTCLVETIPWKLYFDGSVCSKGQGIGCCIVSTSGAQFNLAVRLEFMCTNNQSEYEALVHGLEILNDIGVKVIEAYGDSMLIIQQIKGDSQCLDLILNEYRDKCLDLIGLLDTFCISHVPRNENMIDPP